MARLTKQAIARRLRRRHGTMLVEASIVMTLLIMLTLGLLQYGWVFTKWSQIQDAARQGARVAVLPSTASNDTLFNSNKNGTIDTILSSDGLGSSGYTVTVTPALSSTLATGTVISVTVTVPYGSNTDVRTNPVGNLPSWLVPTPANLKATVTMTREGT